MSRSEKEAMRRISHPRLAIAAAAIVAAATAAACGESPGGDTKTVATMGASATPSGDLAAALKTRLPETPRLPASAPDDPTTYRGVRYRMSIGGQVLIDGQIVPWLKLISSSGISMGTTNAGPGVVRLDVYDGRRMMQWLARTTEPYPPPLQAGFYPTENTQPDRPEAEVVDVVVTSVPAAKG